MIWDVLEGGIAVTAGLSAGSIARVGFGIDSGDRGLRRRAGSHAGSGPPAQTRQQRVCISEEVLWWTPPDGLLQLQPLTRATNHPELLEPVGNPPLWPAATTLVVDPATPRTDEVTGAPTSSRLISVIGAAWLLMGQPAVATTRTIESDDPDMTEPEDPTHPADAAPLTLDRLADAQVSQSSRYAAPPVTSALHRRIPVASIDGGGGSKGIGASKYAALGVASADPPESSYLSPVLATTPAFTPGLIRDEVDSHPLTRRVQAAPDQEGGKPLQHGPVAPDRGLGSASGAQHLLRRGTASRAAFSSIRITSAFG